MPEPGAGEALLRIRRIGVCGTDLHAFEGSQPYFQYPRVLGHELAAELLTPAPGFSRGELLTFRPYFSCGHCVACRAGRPNCCVRIRVCGVHVDGGMTEYLVVPEANLVAGRGLGAEALAMVEPLAIGAHGVRRAAVEPGETVLVVGAGPIGLGAMQFATLAGARVVAMDLREDRLAFCRERLGITHTVPAGGNDVLEQLAALTDGDMPTVVIDATGNRRAIEQAFAYMAHGARFVLIGLQKEPIAFSHPEFHKREATLMSSRNATREDFDRVVGALVSGQVDPLMYITHRVGFDEVGEAFPGWLDPARGVIKAMIEMP